MQIYAFSLNLLREYTIDHIEEGDVALNQLRDQLTNEFEKLQSGIDSLRQAKLKTAQENLADAMIYYGNGIFDKAQKHFEYAQQNAIEAFTTSLDFDSKVLSTKIRLLSLFHLEGYFTTPEKLNIPALEALCRQALKPLFDSVEVQSAIRNHNTFFGFGQKESRRVLAELSALRHAIAKKLSPATHFPLLTTSGKVIDMHEVLLKDISHSGKHITCMTISGDKLYAGLKEGGVILIWDVSTFSELPPLQGHTDTVSCLLVAGDKLFSGSFDNTIRVWNINTREELACLQGHSKDVNCIAFFGNKLYSGGDDETIRMWDSMTFTELACVTCANEVHGMGVAGNRLYDCSYREPTVSVWQLDTLSPNGANLEGHTDNINCMAISANRLCTASADHTIRVWDLTDHTESACLRGNTHFIHCMTMTGNRLYTAGYEDAIRVWDLDNRVEIAYIPTPDRVDRMLISGGKLFVAMPNQIKVSLV